MENFKKCLENIYIIENDKTFGLCWGINQGEEVEVSREFAIEYLSIEKKIGVRGQTETQINKPPDLKLLVKNIKKGKTD